MRRSSEYLQYVMSDAEKRLAVNASVSRHLVVVSSGRQQLVVSAPLQSAHFLSVTLQAALGLQRRRSDVPLQDQPVPAARRQLIHVPRQRT